MCACSRVRLCTCQESQIETIRFSFENLRPCCRKKEFCGKVFSHFNGDTEAMRQDKSFRDLL